MARPNAVFVCGSCGGETLKWQGQCPLCGEWNSLEQRNPARTRPAAPALAVSLGAPAAPAGDAQRFGSGQAELDRVLGGGIVPGSVILLGGDPGIGKSTLLLQVAARVAASRPVIYASGEESVAQIGLRAQRLALTAEALGVVADTDLASILALAAEQRAAVLVIDSIQTVQSGSAGAAAGAVSQLRECTAELVRFAKSSGTAVSIVTVTREGGRPLLIELQGLVDRMRFGAPRRIAQGLDANRLAMLLAAANRHAQLALQEHDVFVNVVGGIQITETAWDLPVLIALASSLEGRALPAQLVAFGELGLTGEVRPVAYGDERLREAYTQGFRSAIVPRDNAPRKPPAGLTVLAVSRVGEALEAAFKASA